MKRMEELGHVSFPPPSATKITLHSLSAHTFPSIQLAPTPFFFEVFSSSFSSLHVLEHILSV